MSDTEERPINSESGEGVNDLLVGQVEGGDEDAIVCEPLGDKDLSQNGSEPRESGANSDRGDGGSYAPIDEGQEGLRMTLDKSSEIQDVPGYECKEDTHRQVDEEKANENVNRGAAEDEEGLVGEGGEEAPGAKISQDDGGDTRMVEEDIVVLGQSLNPDKEDQRGQDVITRLTIEECKAEEIDELSHGGNVMDTDEDKTDVREGRVCEGRMLSDHALHYISPNRHERSLALEEWWMAQIKVGEERLGDDGSYLNEDDAHVRIMSASDVDKVGEGHEGSESSHCITFIQDTDPQDCMAVDEAKENLNEICESVAAVERLVENVVANFPNQVASIHQTKSDEKLIEPTNFLTNKQLGDQAVLIEDVDKDMTVISEANARLADVNESGINFHNVHENQKEIQAIKDSSRSDSFSPNDAEKEPCEPSHNPYFEDKTLCKDIDIFLYHLPVTNGERVVKAKKWDISNPIMTGTLQLVRECNGGHVIFIWDDDNVLQGRAAINYYPSSVLRPTIDSTRYFIFNMTETAGRTTKPFGVGFYDSTKLLEILKAAFDPEPGYGDCSPRQKIRKIDLSKRVERTASVVTQHQPMVSKFGKSVCNKVAISEDSFRMHAINPVNNEYPCQFCLETCEGEKELKTHWEDKHGLRHPSNCVICKLPFPSERAMLSHRSKSHGFSCYICEDKFLEAKAAMDHLRQAHANV